jgi:hypothetical protein
MTIRLFSTLEEELRKLEEFIGQSNFRKFLDHEDVQKRIEVGSKIFSCVSMRPECGLRYDLLFIDILSMTLLCSSRWV